MSGEPGLRPGAHFGPFLILAELGRGGMGRVFRVRGARGRELALKVLLRPDSERQLQRFVREGQITAALQHPGILRVHDAGVFEGWPYLVYELIEGRDLEALLRDTPRAALVQILIAVGEALGHAHAAGVLHRDLKPSNVLVARDGRVVVCDFGLAAGLGLERLTVSGVMIGTPSYMAPEQLAAKHGAFGPPVDVWALGVMLYQVLCGRLPFVAESLLELAGQVAAARTPAPHSVDPEVSPALSAVCVRALSADPAQRYPDGAAFAAALQEALARPHARPRARRKGVAAALGAALVGAATLLIATRGGPPEPAEAAPAPAPSAEPPVAQALDPEDARALERALADPEPAVLRTRLGRLAPELLTAEAAQERVGAAYAALAATLRQDLEARDDAGRPAHAEAQVLPPLRAMAELVALVELPADAAATTPPTLDALVDWTLATLEADRPAPCEAFEVAVALESRPTTPIGGALLYQALAGYRVDPSAADPVVRMIVASARLDLTFGCHRVPLQGEYYLPQGEDPWSAFIRLRLEAAEHGAGSKVERLRLALRETELDVGPRLWADCASVACRTLKPEAALDLIDEALTRDPESPLALYERALQLTRLGREEEAAAATQVAVELYRRLGCDRIAIFHGTFRPLLSLHVRNLAEAGDREAARAGFRQLKPIELDHDTSDRLLRDFPWLEGSR